MMNRNRNVVAAIVVFLLALTFPQGHAYLAPPPDFTSPYENKTDKTMDELITGALGGPEVVYRSPAPGVAPSSVLQDDGKILAELDMRLTDEQFLALYQPPDLQEMVNMKLMNAPEGTTYDEELKAYRAQSSGSSRPKRKAARNPRLRWTRAEMPYLFAKDHFSNKEIYMIRRAMTEWERYTCVKFRPGTSSDANSVRFQNGFGCNSMLGMIGGVQALNLQAPGCRFKGLYLHEIGHALGLVHEHQLPDRDNYIQIVYQNVAPLMRIWFNKYPPQEVNQMGVPYEYSSVMHYGITAFSKDGKSQTIKALDPTKESEIGKVYLKELAYSDVDIVNKMYGCASSCPNKNKCGANGFVDQNCNCICRDGSDDCDTTKTKKDASCVNLYQSWSCYIWANQGECERNPTYMKMNCAKACGACSTSAPKSAKQDYMTWQWQWFPLLADILPSHWTDLGACKDVYTQSKCLKWKERGDCITNSRWMGLNCKAVCNMCEGSTSTRPETNCNNVHTSDEKCDGFAKDGECMVNPDWMYRNCKKACAMCDSDGPTNTTGGGVDEDKMTCEDNNKNCQSWAKAGECKNNPSYMINNCRKSCNKCDNGMCKNLYDDNKCDIWEQKLECMYNSVWMYKHCAKSCGRCNGKGNTTGTMPTTASPGTTRKPSVTTKGTRNGNCANKHRSDLECSNWAENDHCSINPSWMLKNCAKACKVCKTDGGSEKSTSKPDPRTGGKTESPTTGSKIGCVDNNVNCPSWARYGYCDTNPTYSLVNCKKSCNTCNGCRDDAFLCSVWARAGSCNNNPRYMLRHCQKSCKVCKQ